MQKANFDKNTTSAIKGTALILMFIHHFFAYPEWYVTGIAYPQLAGFVRFFRYPVKICVPVFAFLTGYFYAYTNKKTLRYSLRKMTDLLISYWAIYVPVLLFALMTGYRGLSVFGFIQGILGRNISLMTFCWYVSFYCLAMLMLPLLTKTEKPAPLIDVAMMVVLPIAGSTILENLIGSDTLRIMIEEIRLWFPCVASGYLCAKYKLFDAADSRLKGKPECGRAALYAACILAAMTGRYFCDVISFGGIRCFDRDWSIGFTMDLFYAPVFVYGLAKLLQYTKGGYVIRILKCIGNQSLLMWFIHCIFFNVSNEITQKILYWPQHPILVVVFGLAMCYMAALIISPFINRLIRMKNHMLDRLQKS